MIEGKKFYPTQHQGRTGHCGNAANGARLFFENVYFKDIREIEAFLN
jgi:hypothetical protein